MYGGLGSSGPVGGGRLEEGSLIEQVGRIQGHAEGHGLLLAGQDSEQLSSPRTDSGSRRSLSGDEVDASAWRHRSRAAQRVSTTDGSPDSDKAAGNDSSMIVGDRGKASISVSGGGLGFEGDSSMVTGEGLSPGGGGGGGGAFMLVRRDQTKKSSTPPTPLTMVRSAIFN